MGLETRIADGFLTTQLAKAVGWARKWALWPMPFGTACCAIEFMATMNSRYDMARFGAEVLRFSPRQSDLMIVGGRVSLKMMPVLLKIWEQMPEPKWCISMGACASNGGMFDTYPQIQGVDQFIPVDAYIPGCPPRPENVLDALMVIQELVSKRDFRKDLSYSEAGLGEIKEWRIADPVEARAFTDKRRALYNPRGADVQAEAAVAAIREATGAEADATAADSSTNSDSDSDTDSGADEDVQASSSAVDDEETTDSSDDMSGADASSASAESGAANADEAEADEVSADATEEEDSADADEAPTDDENSGDDEAADDDDDSEAEANADESSADDDEQSEADSGAEADHDDADVADDESAQASADGDDAADEGDEEDGADADDAADEESDEDEDSKDGKGD